jgi:hypothetical protein
LGWYRKQPPWVVVNSMLYDSLCLRPIPLLTALFLSSAPLSEAAKSQDLPQCSALQLPDAQRRTA